MKIDRGIRMPKQIHYSSVFITVLITIHHYSLIIAGIKPTHILADLQTLTNLRSCNLGLLPLRSPLATSISLRWVLCCALSQPLTEEVSVSTYPWYLGILSLSPRKSPEPLPWHSFRSPFFFRNMGDCNISYYHNTIQHILNNSNKTHENLEFLPCQGGVITINPHKNINTIT